jgi:hypothetical protein
MTASGITPPAASLPYWEQVFFDDFDTDVPRGGWPGPYSSRWDAYNWGPDTSKQGWYTTETTSVSDSSLILGIGDQGLPRLASVAPIPLISGHTTPSKISGQTYGRYDICYRVDTSLTETEGYKAAWLLWPDSNVWAQGEIDGMESGFTGTIGGFVHEVGDPSINAASWSTNVRFNTGWHVTSLRWEPGAIAVWLDETRVLYYTGAAGNPTVPMHWVIQTETDLTVAPPPTLAGNVYIDWVAVYAWKED